MIKKRFLFSIMLLGGSFAISIVNAKPINARDSHESTQGKNQQNTQNNPSLDTHEEYISQPIVKKISFTGNTIFSSEVLLKAIPLKIQDVANANIIMDSMVKIAQIYKTKNIKVTITPVLEKIAISSTQIQFDIHEQLTGNAN
ncbi:Outer membrane protein assembly factor BamA (BamA) (PDB:5EKQ) [Commensalibacter communis]|uniref:Outer membrane protein assembly factor BamA (BamA) n=1 Tax=Commensalibacter communis TaxID=2972786 RepID=A0A9W4XDT6_9PROT|nr:POTRA domain-containing protein [Commensalibacter communis]CAI3949308.1 Outer membrane protein assembly factor BamA (BamA) (PDB:5EKQ) [Commensalibacter communis]CAI3950578.1 Outer membrane protein assembly factor BamA (BamA) (PDB:5EKQ) [Commensalibacter communis]CAI3952431.1 Outer membrane protein assembly factor BamA (BamA) (PDB:5EKQ) [Commensalibacter communis]CAI3953558.1 Outer membrane protein assembly factor BamA (BamA) (PDB:5EKQ) [Commensalibacter communis]